MKKILLILTALFMLGCTSQANLVQTQQPILNISSELNSLIETELSQDKAWLTNKSKQSLTIQYDLFWYAADGVTQPFSDKQEQMSEVLILAPQQKHIIEFNKPTSNSKIYRLYLRLK